MFNKQILSFSVAVALGLGAQAGLAATITTAYSNSANFGAGNVGYQSGSVAPNPNYAPGALNPPAPGFVAVGVGGDTFVSADHSYDFSATGAFNTWCVDIYHWVTGSQVTYTIDVGGAALATSLSSLRGGAPSGASRVQSLVSLADDVYATLGSSNLAIAQENSAAFQLAVWAITYGIQEGGEYVLNSTNAGFAVSGASAATVAKANGWLHNLAVGVADTGNYQLTYLHDDPNQPVTQDMVVFTQVPEPATLGLLGLGMLGMVWRARRKVSA